MSALTLAPLIAERLALLDGVESTAPGQPSQAEYEKILAFFAPLPGYAPPSVRVSDREAPGPHGPVGVRVYEPMGGTRPSQGVVWKHGGAFVGGGLDMPEADVLAREIVARTGVVVVSVDYRLCRDGIHFPVPHDDVHAAFVWASTASGLTYAGAPWSIGGASAGANLAAGVAQRLRDEGRSASSQILAYPVLHATLPPSSSELDDVLAALPPFLRIDAESGAVLQANFLGDQPASTPYAFPGDGPVAGLPRTLLILCECDGLVASGEAYAADLRAARVEVQVELVRGMVHGHLNMPGLPEALGSIARIAALLGGTSTERT